MFVALPNAGHSAWQATETGREAKFYKITKKGCQCLETEMEGWERMREAVALILRTAE